MCETLLLMLSNACVLMHSAGNVSEHLVCQGCVAEMFLTQVHSQHLKESVAVPKHKLASSFRVQ